MRTFRYILHATLIATSLLSGCASGYKKFYTPVGGATPEAIAASRVSPPPTVPIIERAQPGDHQAILNAYAKRGFTMIGSSSFNSGQAESEDGAVRQGQDLLADLVLILSPRYTGSVTSAIPITTPSTSTSYSNATATAYGSRGSVTAYGTGTTTTYGTTTNMVPITIQRSDYGAVYFVKRRFNLGAYTRDLTDTERQELQTNKGAVVGLVVDGSPAFNADLLVGDVVLSIDGIAVVNTQGFYSQLGERRGKQIALQLRRRGQTLEKNIVLNP